MLGAAKEGTDKRGHLFLSSQNFQLKGQLLESRFLKGTYMRMSWPEVSQTGRSPCLLSINMSGDGLSTWPLLRQFRGLL